MMNPNAKLVEMAKIVTGLSPVAPSTSTPDYVSMKNYEKCTIIICGINGSTVTGSAITVKQSTDVTNSQSDEKAVPISFQHANIDTVATDTLVETAVTSNTFTTVTTNTKEYLYVIEVKADDLDNANGFDCIRAGTGNAVNSTLSVIYILWPAKFGKATPPSAILN